MLKTEIHNTSSVLEISLIEPANIDKLIWTATPNVTVASRLAASVPGVYSFGRVRRLGGLPYAIEWKYIGRSTTGGLRGRLRSHRPLLEANPALQKWLARHHDDAEVWFAPTGSVQAAIDIEKRLIYELDPEFNTVGTPRANRQS